MILSTTQDAVAFTVAPAAPPTIQTTKLPEATSAPLPASIPPISQPPEFVRHMLFGSLSAVQSTIQHLHKLRYAEATDWSHPIPTGKPNEVMVILTKKVH